MVQLNGMVPNENHILTGLIKSVKKFRMLTMCQSFKANNLYETNIKTVTK